jgi:hypothetical protein
LPRTILIIVRNFSDAGKKCCDVDGSLKQRHAPKVDCKDLRRRGKETERNYGRHDIQRNDIQHNDIQHNDIQHNDFQHNDIHRNCNQRITLITQ